MLVAVPVALVVAVLDDVRVLLYDDVPVGEPVGVLVWVLLGVPEPVPVWLPVELRVVVAVAAALALAVRLAVAVELGVTDAVGDSHVGPLLMDREKLTLKELADRRVRLHTAPTAPSAPAGVSTVGMPPPMPRMDAFPAGTHKLASSGDSEACSTRRRRAAWPLGCSSYKDVTPACASASASDDSS